MLWYIFLVCSALAAIGLGVGGVLPPLLAVLAGIGIFALLNGLFVVFIFLINLCCRDREPPETPHPFFVGLAYMTLNWMTKICRVHYSGRNLDRVPQEPTVIISNHLSRFDPMILFCLLKGRKIAFISKKENMANPIIGSILYRLGFLALDRENPIRAMRTIRTGARMVKEDGYTMGIYPESTRNRTQDQLLEFKTGAFVMAKKAGAPVTVTVIRGIRGNARRLFTRASIEVLEVIPAEVVAEKKPEELSEICYQIIAAALEKEAAF